MLQFIEPLVVVYIKQSVTCSHVPSANVPLVLNFSICMAVLGHLTERDCLKLGTYGEVVPINISLQDILKYRHNIIS